MKLRNPIGCVPPVVVLVCSLLLVAPAQGEFFQQGPKLVGTGAIGDGFQGNSVSLSGDGDTAIVGAPFDNGSAGAAWVYARSGGVWNQQAKLVGAGAIGPAEQGYSVSLSADGNTAIVGGLADNGDVGAAWVYTRSGAVWSQQTKLVGTGAIGVSVLQGFSVFLSGDGNTAIVGAPGDNNMVDTGPIGAAWVYVRSGGVWSQQAKLVGFGAVGSQQRAVSLSGDGDTAIVGGPGDNGNSGAAWVFTRSGGLWNQQAKLVGTGAIGPAEQGYSVSLSGDGNTASVGGLLDNSGAGAVWVFMRSARVWNQQAKLVGTGAVNTAEQGVSVSLSSDGDTAIVGGPSDNSSSGAAWVFRRSESLCCTDQQLGEVSPPHRHLFEANVFRPPKLQHTVERRDSNGHLGRLPPFGPRAQRVTNHSLVAADIGFYQGTPIVTRCPLPAHAAALGDQLQVPVALGRRGLCRGAWHRARTWRHNDRRIGMTLADLTVDIVPIVRSIAGKRHNRSRDLLKQGTDLRTVIDILAGQLGGDDLSRVGIHPDMELSPGPTRPCGVLLDEPLTGTAELEPCAVHQQVYRFAARWWSRHRQCLAATAHRRMVWRREIKTQQRKNGCDQPFGLA
jgi:hypothetical protein